jgi:hypothetical protein
MVKVGWHSVYVCSFFFNGLCSNVSFLTPQCDKSSTLFATLRICEWRVGPVSVSISSHLNSILAFVHIKHPLFFFCLDRYPSMNCDLTNRAYIPYFIGSIIVLIALLFFAVFVLYIGVVRQANAKLSIFSYAFDSYKPG